MVDLSGISQILKVNNILTICNGCASPVQAMTDDGFPSWHHFSKNLYKGYEKVYSALLPVRGYPQCQL
jgi:hypothetical protein